MIPFDQRACFIAGQAKSGTTLVAALLDNHPELLALPQETAYFPTLLKKYGSAGRRAQFDYLTNESFSRVLFGGDIASLVIGEVDDVWDTCVLVEYPSAASFATIVTSPEVTEIGVHRAAGLEGQLLIRLTPSWTTRPPT